MSNENIATVRFAEDDLFIGITPSGHAIALDTNHDRAVAPSPVELLLVALGACTAVDVIGILRKKRFAVESYHVEVRGLRRDEFPRSFTKMTVHHVLRGAGLTARAVEQAIQLSETKYCSVAATFRPNVEVDSTFEIVETDVEKAKELALK